MFLSHVIITTKMTSKIFGFEQRQKLTGSRARANKFQSIEPNMSTLILILWLIPCHRLAKSARRNLRNNARRVRGSEQLFVVSMSQFVSKSSKIVPYHSCAQTPRLTVSVPNYGSWLWWLKEKDSHESCARWIAKAWHAEKHIHLIPKWLPF